MPLCAWHEYRIGALLRNVIVRRRAPTGVSNFFITLYRTGREKSPLLRRLRGRRCAENLFSSPSLQPVPLAEDSTHPGADIYRLCVEDLAEDLLLPTAMACDTASGSAMLPAVSVEDASTAADANGGSLRYGLGERPGSMSIAHVVSRPVPSPWEGSKQQAPTHSHDHKISAASCSIGVKRAIFVPVSSSSDGGRLTFYLMLWFGRARHGSGRCLRRCFSSSVVKVDTQREFVSDNGQLKIMHKHTAVCTIKWST